MISDNALRLLAANLKKAGYVCRACNGSTHEGGGCPACNGRSAPRNWSVPFEEMREIVDELVQKRGLTGEDNDERDGGRVCPHCYARLGNNRTTHCLFCLGTL